MKKSTVIITPEPDDTEWEKYKAKRLLEEQEYHDWCSSWDSRESKRRQRNVLRKAKASVREGKSQPIKPKEKLPRTVGTERLFGLSNEQGVWLRKHTSEDIELIPVEEVA
jgi:hypothetical protein